MPSAEECLNLTRTDDYRAVLTRLGDLGVEKKHWLALAVLRQLDAIDDRLLGCAPPQPGS
jgi:hypothetical protein